MARFITAAQLRKAGACAGYQDRFEALFGKQGRVRVTDLAAEALAQAFNWSWAGENLLTFEQYRVFKKRMIGVLSISDRVDAEVASLGDRAVPCQVLGSIGIAARETYKYHQALAFAAAYNSPKR
jgi:hypothetical protein